MGLTSSSPRGQDRLKTEWVRRNYYVEGTYIRPKADSPVERYDPFAAYYSTGSRSPQSMFLELATLDLEDSRAIEAFTSAWGLLGLFFDRILQYELQSQGPHEEGTGEERSAVGMSIAVTAPNIAFENLPDAFIQNQSQSGLSVVAIVRDPNGGRYRQIPAADYCRSYMPELYRHAGSQSHDTVSQLLPLVLSTEQRWDYMCEPLDEFRKAVSEFQTTYRICSEWSTGSRPRYLIWQIDRQFQRHFQQVHPYPFHPQNEAIETTLLDEAGDQTTDEPWRIAWAFPTLLSAAYMMLFLEFTGNSRLSYCANNTCSRPMVAQHPSRIYCSDSCQNVVKQRAFRNRKRATGGSGS